MKKIICVLSVIAILFSCCACSAKSKDPTLENITTTETNQKNESKIKKTNTKKKVLSLEQASKVLTENGFEVMGGTYTASWNIIWPNFKDCISASNRRITVVICEATDFAQAEQNLEDAINQFKNSYTEKKHSKGINYEEYVFEETGVYCSLLAKVDNITICVGGYVPEQDISSLMKQIVF